jgi:hypothetical protein
MPSQSQYKPTNHDNRRPSQFMTDHRPKPIQTEANQDSYQSEPKLTKTHTNPNPGQPILSLGFILSLHTYIALVLDLGFNKSAISQKKFQKLMNWNICIKLGVPAGIGRDYIPLPWRGREVPLTNGGIAFFFLKKYFAIRFSSFKSPELNATFDTDERKRCSLMLSQ